ncbi:MAG: Gfo/Idh/MocA family oxidoreductase [Ruminiclostridium sp.]|nr:Gfo/Idh/MocA family oxidoreductase [Ruminiclostridium sp.]
MRILIAGTGSIGRRHIEVIHKVEEHRIILCDTDEKSLKESAEKFGIDEYYTDFDKAVEKNIDGVIICTPNNFHASMTIKALDTGCHVLVEKPIASSVKDAGKMVAASEKNKRSIMVGYILRCYPHLEYIKEIIEKGELGKIVSFRVLLNAPETLRLAQSDYRKSYETGGGIIYDYSHEIDYLRYLIGTPRRFVCFNDLLLKYDKTCDDIAEILIQFEGGALGSIHMDYFDEHARYSDILMTVDNDIRKKSGRTLGIIGEKASVHTNFSDVVEIYKVNGGIDKKQMQIERNDAFTKQFNKFVKVIKGEKPAYVSGQDGFDVLCICAGLYESNAKGIVYNYSRETKI